MSDFDPFDIIENVCNDQVHPLQLRVFNPSQLKKVNFVAVLSYGRPSCTVIPSAKFATLMLHDIHSMYSQSILIPPVADWLCRELQEPFGFYQDVASLAVAYFALIDNHRSSHQRVIHPMMVRQDIMRYSLFYYLLRADTHMDRWSTLRMHENVDNPARFAYSKTLEYIKQLDEYDGMIDMYQEEIAPTDSFLESFLPMIAIVTSWVSKDFKMSLDLD